jgi:hypothetical protein
MILNFRVYHQRQGWFDSLLCEFECTFDILLQNSGSVENSGMLKQFMKYDVSLIAIQ